MGVICIRRLGRLDVFTRVIADKTQGFDRIAAGYHGPLYAEISPKTFPILVREGSRLSQIRFRQGQALLDPQSLRALHARYGGVVMLKGAGTLVCNGEPPIGVVPHVNPGMASGGMGTGMM